MSNKKSITTLSIAAGTAFVASLAMGNVANAAEGANPFAMNELSSGYMQLAGSDHKHEKMEGKCGGKKMKKEGSCGGMKGKKKEGSCGGDMKGKKDMKKGKKEGKCGEGKCGGKG